MLITATLRPRLYFVPSEANPWKYAPMPAVFGASAVPGRGGDGCRKSGLVFLQLSDLGVPQVFPLDLTGRGQR